jgi:hypothetical protein
MERLDAYLQRKQREIALLNGCLDAPLKLQRPTSAMEVIKQKFQIAGALKAEHAIQDWALTETAWAHTGRMKAGPFEFSYDYQRADLEVRGPSFYAHAGQSLHDTVYTSSGMSAISALLLTSVKVVQAADILIMPGAYGETVELIESYAHHLRIVQTRGLSSDLASSSDRFRILLFDSSASSLAFEAILRCAAPCLNLIIFDTTCFSSGSGRIRRVLSWARRWRLPIVLVRSHTKLDSLGLEYGRLGSAVFVDAEEVCPPKRDILKGLSGEMQGGSPVRRCRTPRSFSALRWNRSLPGAY